MRKFIAEFLGTFALVFCGTGAIVINDVSSGSVTHAGIAITFGFIVTAMIYTFGHISGAHLNPAVSLAFATTDRFDRKLTIIYIVAQLLGAMSASLLLYWLFPNHHDLGSTLPQIAILKVFVIELLLTYFLMLSILFVSQNAKISHLTGFVVGQVVLLEAMFAGLITGASMNPARSIAPALVSGNLSNLWTYIFAPIAGALLASLTWKYLEENNTK